MAARRRRQVARTHVSSVRLRNFRCYRDSGDIPFRPLTIILGPNNVGKSTIINSILLLKQTVDVDAPRETVITSGPLVDLGGFADIIHRGAPRNERFFSIEMVASHLGPTLFTGFVERDKAKSKDGGTVGLSETFGYSKAANQILTREIEYRRDGKPELRFKSHGARVVLLRPDGSERNDVDVALFGSLPIVHVMPSKRRGADEATSRELAELTNNAVAHGWGWIEYFRSLTYLAPLRTPIPRYAMPGVTSPGTPGTNPAELLQELKSRRKVGPDGEALIAVVEHWAEKHLEILRGLKMKLVDRAGTVFVLLGDERNGFRGINIASMGEGVSQLLPILGSLLGSRRGGCTLIEQPELHLHPDLQARLADLFIDQVVHRDKQVILETHSEHVLLRVRRRVAEGLDPDSVSILYVDRPGKESRVRRLPIESDGSMPDWPDGFFEEGLTESFKIATARKAEG